MFGNVCWLSGLNMVDRNGCLLLSFSSSINQYQPHSGEYFKERSAGHDHYVVFCDDCESVHTIDTKKQYIYIDISGPF